MYVLSNLKQNSELKEQVERCLSYKFDTTESAKMGKTMKNYNTPFIDIIMFYNNIKSPLFKVLGIVVYFLLEKYFCIDYLCLQQLKKLYLSHRLFEDTPFDDISGIGIPGFFLNILPCYVFVQEVISIFILVCRRKLV